MIFSEAHGPGFDLIVCGVPGPKSSHRFSVTAPSLNGTGLPCCWVTHCSPHPGGCCNHGDPNGCPADPLCQAQTTTGSHSEEDRNA